MLAKIKDSIKYKQQDLFEPFPSLNKSSQCSPSTNNQHWFNQQQQCTQSKIISKYHSISSCFEFQRRNPQQNRVSDLNWMKYYLEHLGHTDVIRRYQSLIMISDYFRYCINKGGASRKQLKIVREFIRPAIMDNFIQILNNFQEEELQQKAINILTFLHYAKEWTKQCGKFIKMFGQRLIDVLIKILEQKWKITQFQQDSLLVLGNLFMDTLNKGMTFENELCDTLLRMNGHLRILNVYSQMPPQRQSYSYECSSFYGFFIKILRVKQVEVSKPPANDMQFWKEYRLKVKEWTKNISNTLLQKMLYKRMADTTEIDLEELQ